MLCLQKGVRELGGQWEAGGSDMLTLEVGKLWVFTPLAKSRVER